MLKKVLLFVSLFINVIFIALIIYYNNSNLVTAPNFYIKSSKAIATHFERGTPIDRYYIYDFLDKHKEYIKGKVLEMEPVMYAPIFKDKIESVDSLTLSPDENATYVMDLQDTYKFPSNKYDCYIMTQTLQYPYDTKAVLKSSYKLLKNGGAIIITAPITSQITAYRESWRFTEFSIRRLLEDAGFKIIDTQSYGNTFANTLFLQGIAYEDVKNKKLLDRKEYICPMLVAALAVKQPKSK